MTTIDSAPSTGLRPRRSVLYMPGANERALEKAKGIPADALILDLEDAVAPDAKVAARANVCAAAQSGEYGYREIAIRVNAIGTEWHDDDLAAAAEAGPDAVLVPKVDSAEEVRRLEAALVAAGAPAHTRLWAMLETPDALLDARAIAAASERLAVLVLGTNDIARELHAAQTPGRPGLLTAISLCLVGARAAGKVIIDGVYNDIKDPDGFLAEAEQGRDLGFDGKTLIHPSQVEPCNEVWTPSAEAIEDARGLIATFEEAIAAGKGVVTYKGRMIENLHVDNARRVIAVADAIAAQS
jgi:citrate lyase subunit beta/citryl-CoA lyase